VSQVMKPTRKLHDLGQSLWLDNITRELLNSGTLARYIHDLSVTGLTSNPTIFDRAIENSTIYDEEIREKGSAASAAEELFFDLALEDVTRAADLFQPVFERTDGVDGWVSLEVSPLLAHDTQSTLSAARSFSRSDRWVARSISLRCSAARRGAIRARRSSRSAMVFARRRSNAAICRW